MEMRKHDADWPIAIIAGKPLSQEFFEPFEVLCRDVGLHQKTVDFIGCKNPLLFRFEPLLILGADHRLLTFATEPLVRARSFSNLASASHG